MKLLVDSNPDFKNRDEYKTHMEARFLSLCASKKAVVVQATPAPVATVAAPEPASEM